jgi:hypothetical protein
VGAEIVASGFGPVGAHFGAAGGDEHHFRIRRHQQDIGGLYRGWNRRLSLGNGRCFRWQGNGFFHGGCGGFGSCFGFGADRGGYGSSACFAVGLGHGCKVKASREREGRNGALPVNPEHSVFPRFRFHP